jgi:catechol 2,3-dioxygenase-like lactoylglutathione lyase family enzyme
MTTEETSALLAATPVLPSLDIARTVAFYCGTLGFEEVHAVPREYAIIERGPIELHFWYAEDAALPKASGCRVHVTGIDALYTLCQVAGIVHPNAPLAAKPWGTREFAVLDPDGNCLTFHESAAA